MTDTPKRVVLVGAGLFALVSGLLVGVAACSFCDLQPIENGLYEIVESPERTELVGASVEIRDEAVEISFTDSDGNDWLVRYAITGRTP